MTSRPDLTPIEERIAELAAAFARPEASERTLPASCAPLVDASVRQALASSQGGKRLRALLLLDTFAALAPDATGNQRAAALDLACAIEVFQTAALVHDDIIDDSDMRRGKPSAHRALAEAASSAPVGMGLGIMLGDVLATASVEVAERAARAFAARDHMVDVFLGMHRQVEYGQILDLAVERADLADPQALVEASLEVFRWKTASYTTVAPLHLTLLAAGFDAEAAADAALAVGEPLGVAFQLADDVLDVTASPERSGKPCGGDIREGKRTVLLADALLAADPAQAARLRSLFEAASRGNDEVREVMDAFESTGAIERSRQRIADCWCEARTALEALPIPPQAVETIRLACARFLPADVDRR